MSQHCVEVAHSAGMTTAFSWHVGFAGASLPFLGQQECFAICTGAAAFGACDIIAHRCPAASQASNGALNMLTTATIIKAETSWRNRVIDYEDIMW